MEMCVYFSCFWLVFIYVYFFFDSVGIVDMLYYIFYLWVSGFGIMMVFVVGLVISYILGEYMVVIF